MTLTLLWRIKKKKELIQAEDNLKYNSHYRRRHPNPSIWNFTNQRPRDLKHFPDGRIALSDRQTWPMLDSFIPEKETWFDVSFAANTSAIGKTTTFQWLNIVPCSQTVLSCKALTSEMFLCLLTISSKVHHPGWIIKQAHPQDSQGPPWRFRSPQTLTKLGSGRITDRLFQGRRKVYLILSVIISLLVLKPQKQQVFPFCVTLVMSRFLGIPE